MKLCVIPARGGSKRIPGKNIREFCGQPIIAYSIKAAINSGCFDRVVVSSDDEEIIDIARSYGATVPFIRPNELSDDYTGTIEVIKHAIKWFEDNGEKIEQVCCIYATAPFVTTEYIKKGLEKLVSTGKSFSFSVTSYAFPIQRAIRVNSNDEVEAIWEENIYKRSQDLEEAYHDAGQFYWGTRDAFMNDEVIFSKVSTPVVLPRYLVQDIDTLEDWDRAELMYKALIKNQAVS